MTVETLRNDFSVFGEIELINIVSDRNIAFVNFTDVLSAIKAVDVMKCHPDYTGFKINYGKDRCGNEPRAPRDYSPVDIEELPELSLESVDSLPI